MPDAVLKKYAYSYHPVVEFDATKDMLKLLDFTNANKELTDDIYNNTERLSDYVQQKIQAAGAAYGIGGYAEKRSIYSRSNRYNNEAGEPRRLHLGIDIWAPASTKVFAPIGGMVHSFANNADDGNYGGTIVLLHQLDGLPFYTLYGHLSLASLGVREGLFINRGEVFATLGTPAENGNWPPHLHFQVIYDMELHNGDYPGVCAYSERKKYMSNCPNPDIILQMMKHAIL